MHRWSTSGTCIKCGRADFVTRIDHAFIQPASRIGSTYSKRLGAAWGGFVPLTHGASCRPAIQIGSACGKRPNRASNSNNIKEANDIKELDAATLKNNPLRRGGLEVVDSGL